MLQQVIVVEGQQDVVAVRKALEADMITTGGFTLNKQTLAQIEAAYQKRGIIILTDPDRAGERIRQFLSERFPLAAHAFVPREEAFNNNDIGVEQASPESIRRALSKLKTHTRELRKEFDVQDLLRYGLTGEQSSAVKRDAIGALLGIGWGNAKQFVYRLNNYGISRSEFENAAQKVCATAQKE